MRGTEVSGGFAVAWMVRGGHSPPPPPPLHCVTLRRRRKTWEPKAPPAVPPCTRLDESAIAMEEAEEEEVLCAKALCDLRSLFSWTHRNLLPPDI